MRPCLNCHEHAGCACHMHRAVHPAAQVNDADVASVKNAIEVSLAAFAKPATAVRPKLTVQGISEDRQELLHTLMDTYVKNDVLSIQQSIVNREQRGRVEAWSPVLSSAAAAATAAAATAVAAAGSMLGCRWEQNCPSTLSISCLAGMWHRPCRCGVHVGALSLHV